MAKINVAGGGTVEMKIRDLKGRKVRTRREMSTMQMSIPAGTVLKVDGVWRSGVHLEGDPCGRCGVTVYLRKVERADIELVD